MRRSVSVGKTDLRELPLRGVLLSWVRPFEIDAIDPLHKKTHAELALLGHVRLRPSRQEEVRRQRATNRPTKTLSDKLSAAFELSISDYLARAQLAELPDPFVTLCLL